jgi:riboflavin synthase
MFTGIVQAQGKTVGIEPVGGFVRLRFLTSLDLSDVEIGDSLCVNGVCLTLTHLNLNQAEFYADVSPETVRVTTLGALSIGSTVNLEKALRLGDRLGGHIVSGHVDCVGTIAEKRSVAPGFGLAIQVPSDRYVIEKGSVAVDGVSLTVNSVDQNKFWVMIIPHTSIRSGLTQKKIGDRVNVEFDIIGKYIEKFVSKEKRDSGLTEQSLREYGFI